MDCASCVAHVEKALKGTPGVESYRVNLARGRASVKFDPARTNPQELAAAVSEAGYPTVPETIGAAGENPEEQRLRRQEHAARAWFRRWGTGRSRPWSGTISVRRSRPTVRCCGRTCFARWR